MGRFGWCLGVGSEEGAEVEGGLAVGDHADGLGLADLESVGVTQRLQLGGLLADQVVKAGEVEGVAGDVEMAGARPLSVVAVEEAHIPGGLALLVAGLQQVRVIGGDGLGDRGLDRPPPTRTDPVRQLGVDGRRTGLERVGGWAISGQPRVTVNAATAALTRVSRRVGPGRAQQPHPVRVRLRARRRTVRG